MQQLHLSWDWSFCLTPPPPKLCVWDEILCWCWCTFSVPLHLFPNALVSLVRSANSNSEIWKNWAWLKNATNLSSKVRRLLWMWKVYLMQKIVAQILCPLCKGLYHATLKGHHVTSSSWIQWLRWTIAFHLIGFFLYVARDRLHE